VAISSGINAHCGLDYSHEDLIDSVKQLSPDFVQAKSRRAVLFELDVGEDYLKRSMHREIHFLEYGSKRLELEHTALLPKGKYLSVALIGNSIDEAVPPKDMRRIIREFYTLPQIERILPHIETAPIACACFPRMAVAPARSPFGDRFAIVGDAVGARLNKDGLYSAHVTANQLARTILHDGIDKQALEKGYGKGIEWLAEDNRYGRIVFYASRVAFTWPAVSRIMYQSFATEFKVRDQHRRPVIDVLWKIASSTADCSEVLREMFGYRVLQSILVGAAVTLRNVAVELLFGLKWGVSGRYPTVVLKEKRNAVKKFLSSWLEMDLNESLDFERMYVIKIRGSEEEIMDELASFGQPNARFLNLRFVSVRQVQGTPNQVGSVIQYKLPLIGLGIEMYLARKVGIGTLLYQVNERLLNRGKLIFNVAPTKDGNNKLTIYTAFDFKRGTTFANRALWRSARLLFPEFVHDVVWNHAMCTIKEDVELHS
jgi:hypothetical protein